MRQKVNYQKILDKTLEELKMQEKIPTLLLHSCCAPCSSYVLEYLSNYFSITLFYYNPNIYPPKEYEHRVEEQKRLIASMNLKYTVSFLEGEYQPDCFFSMAKGMEYEPEGGKRCYECYRLRLEEAARMAVRQKADYFTTTLSISPLKHADWLNEIGEELSKKYNIAYLFSDFKKKGGYQRSIELSNEYQLYRQNFCGCVYSKKEAAERKAGIGIEKQEESDETSK